MTQILTGMVDSGRSSWQLLRDFIAARARRIVPALVALCVALLIFGWFFLAQSDYRLLANHVISSLSFLSNFKYWMEADYFDVVSHEKWLLHTWSLSVEWQFYVLLPLVFLAVRRFRNTHMVIPKVYGLLFMLSLCISVWLTPQHPGTAFYLLPTRAWEMLAGGLVYLLASRASISASAARICEWAGLTLIFASMILWADSAQWPGWKAIIPVVGTCLVLLAARSDSWLTANGFLQWLGLRSYSIYLWHWPLVVLMAYASVNSSWIAIGCGLLLSLLLGAASYRFVENKSAKWLSGTTAWRSLVVVFLVTAGVGGAAIVVRQTDGVAGRLAPAAQLAFAEIDNKNPRVGECLVASNEPAECKHGGPEIGVIVLGDSHAASLMSSVQLALPNANLHVLDWTRNACPTIRGAKADPPSYSAGCDEFTEFALEHQKTIPRHIPIVLISRTSAFALGLNEDSGAGGRTPLIYFDRPAKSTDEEFLAEFSRRLTSSACDFAKWRPVWMVRPIPEMGIDVPRAVGRALILGQTPQVSITTTAYTERNAMVMAAQDRAAEQCGIRILDPLPYLCSKDACFGARDGRPVYFDDDHLSEYGGQLVSPMFREIFAKPTPIVEPGSE